MNKNVKIPLSLLSQTISLLEHLDMSDYDYSTQIEYDNILYTFLKKQQSLDLREAYSNIIFAEDENARFEARMRYLQKKRSLNDDF